MKTLDLTGDVAVMARYQGQVAVFRATIPLGVPVDKLPPAKNFIDELVFSKLKTLGLPPSPVVRRRDVPPPRRRSTSPAGCRPPEETEQFLADTRPDKRDKLVDRLLASTDYADYFANKWSAILRNKRRQTRRHARHASRSTTGSATACTRTSRTTSSSARS